MLLHRRPAARQLSSCATGQTLLTHKLGGRSLSRHCVGAFAQPAACEELQTGKAQRHHACGQDFEATEVVSLS